MKNLTLLTLISLVLSAAGCTSTPALIREMVKDKSSSALRVRTVYGTIDYTRVGTGTNSIVISPEGATTVNR